MDEANEHIQIFHHARHIPPLLTVTPSTRLLPCPCTTPKGYGHHCNPFHSSVSLAGKLSGGDPMGPLHSSLRPLCFQRKNPAPKRPQTGREEGTEKIPCIPRLPGLQTSWRMCGEARPLGPVPKVPLPPSCLASVCLFLLMFGYPFQVLRRPRGVRSLMSKPGWTVQSREPSRPSSEGKSIPVSTYSPMYTLAHPPSSRPGFSPELTHTSKFLSCHR